MASPGKGAGGGGASPHLVILIIDLGILLNLKLEVCEEGGGEWTTIIVYISAQKSLFAKKYLEHIN